MSRTNFKNMSFDNKNSDLQSKEKSKTKGNVSDIMNVKVLVMSKLNILHNLRDRKREY